MDGVTILNTYMWWTRSSGTLLAFVIFFLLVGIVFGIALFANGDDEYIGGLIICLCIAGIFIMLFNVPKTKHIQATLDDSVSYAELTDKYEIVKSEGRIVTMIEKEQKDDTE